jgi:hypothetical protein
MLKQMKLPNFSHVLVLLLLFVGHAAKVSKVTEVSTVEPFSIPAISGKDDVAVSKDPKHSLTVLCFLGTECPLAKLYAGRLQQFSDQFQEVRFIGISSNVQDSVDEVARYIGDNEISFEFGKDYDNIVADQLAVTRTPEVIVFDKKRNIVYRGRIDDQYLPGVARNSVQRHDLKLAIEQFLAGKAVEVAVTKPEGCLLGRIRKPEAGATVTFANQVSRVLQRNCVECHRAGEIGPFSLETYEESVGWADMMLEVIEEKRMPPWHADPSIGKFANARDMPESDKQILRDWVDQGTPMGDVSQLPEPYATVEGWRLHRQPDQIVEMRGRPFEVPADGSVEYQYFVVDPKFTEDRWVSAAEVVPGNRSVVHHCIVFIRPPDGIRPRGVGWLAAYVPGQTPLAHQPNQARFVPKGSRLVFQMHYTPNGTAQTDLTKIGLVFADDAEVENELVTVMALDQGFEIEPHDESHFVNISKSRLPRNGQLLSVSPHMHYRGTGFEAWYVNDANEKKRLLNVPAYDFNWQHRYEFADPIPLSSIRRLHGKVEFDNSAGNPFNPDPSQFVTWGDQTWEEMAVGFFDLVVPRVDGKADPTIESQEIVDRRRFQKNDDREKKIDELVKQVFKRFDANRDGVIEKDEVPRSVGAFGFWRFDTNGDKQLSSDEVRKQVESRLK